MARTATSRKAKKTLSLSRDSVAYLEHKRKRAQKASISEVVEEMIQASKLASEKERISAGVRSYYDSLPSAEQEENRSWGQFSESQFPND
jgi:hypothetical protein